MPKNKSSLQAMEQDPDTLINCGPNWTREELKDLINIWLEEKITEQLENRLNKPIYMAIAKEMKAWGDSLQELVDGDIQDQVILNMETVFPVLWPMNAEEEENVPDATVLSPHRDLCDTAEVPETQKSVSVPETPEDPRLGTCGKPSWTTPHHASLHASLRSGLGYAKGCPVKMYL
ncbi:hypothetical protein Y1Q_0004685 [Alligator mississippiensis]|uniref:Uncharacterized protein n=1 Tax=Alligator mississippiensis TaxID=8496 RepID=A0A151P696_ALLMI|nr:hypothetical protein Y1Q_0004685 [Alligator mississippiensis]